MFIFVQSVFHAYASNFVPRTRVCCCPSAAAARMGISFAIAIGARERVLVYPEFAFITL
jgi:hypothetical protein